MENLSNSSSSKVKVEYTDLSGVYPFIASDLNSRLPLRNLHWNSSSRPLRSIDSLYVELVSDESPAPPLQRRAASSAGLLRPQEFALSTRESADTRRGSEPFVSKKERRHQIPGLRQTPYVKLYLFRCDDSDTYKASSRKLLREWVKANTPPVQSSTSVNNQENHDAFEYMIIHVVLPDVQNNAAWPTRASLNILEKVRTEFNSSSRPGVDHVAQIPATKSLQVQGASVNPIPSGPARELFLKESHQAWDDLLSKLKGLILTSFDFRVRQYEEDIKAKSAQRNLPGWNFCTFFVLKEGLAKGFESVGLVEDALISYDELSVELSVTVDEENRKAAAGEEASLFRRYTQELLISAEAAIASAQNTSLVSPGLNDFGVPLLDVERKPCRELILANNISAFDFESYVFARQIALLSRIARLTPTAGSTTGALEQEDMMVLAEEGQRAVHFITSAGNSIRKDLHISVPTKNESDETALAIRYNVVENIVASWTFNSCQQILSETAPVRLVHQIRSLSQGSPTAATSFEQDTGKRSMLNTRPGPLPRFPHSSTLLLGDPLSTTASPSWDSFTEDVSHSQKSPPQNEAQTGLYMLSAQRAELLVIARRSLRSLGKRQGWSLSWPGITRAPAEQYEEEMDEVALNDTPNREPATPGIEHPISKEQTSTICGVQSEILKTALSSRAHFFSAYEAITSEARNHYKLSEDRRSTEAMTADLALIRYELEDYAAAVALLYQLAPFYVETDWTDLEMSILETCAQCLQKLDRRKEYIKITLKILASIVRRNSEISCSTALGTPSGNESVQGGNKICARKYLNDLMIVAKKENEPVVAPMKDYFADIQLDSCIRHFEHKDGFEVLLNICYLLPATLEVRQIQARLVSATEGQHGEIWLSRDEPIEMRRGRITTFLLSNTMIPAWYLLDRITIRVDNIIFSHNLPLADSKSFLASSEAFTTSDSFGAFKSRVLIWPRHRSLETRVSLYSGVHLEEPRSILCEIFSGRNAISSGKLLVRAASAGLRLHTASAELIDGHGIISDQSQAGVVCFEQLSEHSIIKIKIPYRLDTEMKEISLKTETAYTTPDGVNVHDIFKEHALFSKFSISTSTLTPLRLLECHLEGTLDFLACSPGMPVTNLCIFARQPVSMVYKITPIERAEKSTGSLQTRLSMAIRFVCFDEEVLATVLEVFAKSLNKSAFTQFSRVLLYTLSTALHFQLSHQDLEPVGLLREFTIGTFDDIHWEQILVALPQDKRQELKSWLVQWHKHHSIIQIPSSFNALQARRITIPVDVPQTQIVHTARLRLHRMAPNGRTQANAIAVGHAVPAELILKHTRRWDTRGRGSEHGKSTPTFCYELDAGSDTWLIGGRRRARFMAKEHEVLTFPILLIPQRAGHLMYPSIDIKYVEEDGDSIPIGSPGSRGLDETLSCEVEYRNHGESVMVVPDLGCTTIDLDSENGNGGGAWLLESQSKQDADS